MTEPLVTVYLVNATRTLAGPGPGPKELPPAEAAALVAAKYAVHGTSRRPMSGPSPPCWRSRLRRPPADRPYRTDLEVS
jgi:hypothetical protein